MFRLLGFAIFLFLLPVLSKADPLVDSLKQLVIENEPGTPMVQLHCDLAWEYIMAESDSALVFARKAEQLAEEKKDLKGIALAREHQGIYYEMVANDYDKAADIYLNTIKFCEDNNLDYSKNIYHNLGILFHMSDSYEKGKLYYEKSLELARQYQDTSLIKKCLINLGTVTSSLGQNKDARNILLQCLEFPQDDAYNLSIIYSSIGNTYYREQNFTEALPWLLKSVGQIQGEQIEPELISYTYILDCKAALLDDSDLAIWISRTEALLEETEILRDRNITYKSLATSYAVLKNFEESNNYYKQYITSYDSLKVKQRDELVYELEEEFNREKNKVALQRVSARNKFLGTFLAILALAVFGLFYLFMQNKKKSIELGQKNQLLEKSNEEKSLLLKEIHHRVKNNLQTISSMLRMQSRTIEDPIQKSIFTKGEDRVRAMALLHQNLYQEETLTGVNVKIYIDELILSLNRSYNFKQEKITIHTDVDSLLLNIDTAIPIGLIINELVTNAIKHAFPKGQPGVISIRLKESEAHLCLIVSDDGTGMAGKSLETKGTGMKLIQAFSRKLNGKMKIDSTIGTSVQVDIFKYKKA